VYHRSLHEFTGTGHFSVTISKGHFNTPFPPGDMKIQNNGWVMANDSMQSERWHEGLIRWGDVLSSRTYTVHMLLRVPLDEVEPRQVRVIVVYSRS
jgi:hypothetical protein